MWSASAEIGIKRREAIRKVHFVYDTNICTQTNIYNYTCTRTYIYVYIWIRKCNTWSLGENLEKISTHMLGLKVAFDGWTPLGKLEELSTMLAETTVWGSKSSLFGFWSMWLMMLRNTKNEITSDTKLNSYKIYSKVNPHKS